MTTSKVGEHIVTLSSDTLQRINAIALYRQEQKRGRNQVNQKISTQNALQIEISGLKGEFAVAQYYDIEPNLGLEADEGWDLIVNGTKIDVKYTKYHAGDLFFTTPNHFKAEIAILAVEAGPSEVELKGWIKRHRSSGRIVFITLRDSTGDIQCVAKDDVVGAAVFSSLKAALIESSLDLQGVVVEDERAPNGYEMNIVSAELIGAVNPSNPFPITESAMAEGEGGETEFLLDNRHLYLRTSRMTTMLKIRSSVFGAVHSYFRDREFIEYQAPCFVAGAVEGGST